MELFEAKIIVQPGERIRELLAERGWTQDDLADFMGRVRPAITNIINGKTSITPETAHDLGRVFKTGPEYWMTLETTYRLSLVKPTSGDAIEHMVKLYEIAPVKEMERRKWIKPTKGAAELERELMRFYGVETLNTPPAIAVATKRSSPVDSPLTPAQSAWCFRAKQMASVVHVQKFRPELLPHCQDRLRELAAHPEGGRQVATVLAGYGIRFVVIEPLLGSRIDGAAFWLAADAPVIALSIRFDRIDAFWFALAHEFIHVRNGDASVDTDLVGEAATPSEAKAEMEQAADDGATEMLVPSKKLQSFIVRVGPLYSQQRINQFAHVMRIHPGVIVGQLHHRGEVPWSSHRQLLAKIRPLVTETALTDGWGKTIAADLAN